MVLTQEQIDRITPAMQEYEFFVTVQVWKATGEHANKVLETLKEIGQEWAGKPCGRCMPDVFKRLYKTYNPQGRTHDQ